ncbi:hypothetical protein SNE40_017084 [Patella caerulea]
MLMSNFYLDSKNPGIISKCRRAYARRDICCEHVHVRSPDCQTHGIVRRDAIAFDPEQNSDGNETGGHREQGHHEHLHEQDSTHASRTHLDSRCQVDSTRNIHDVEECRDDNNWRISDIPQEEHENTRERIGTTSEYNNSEFDENDDGDSFYFRFSLDQIKEEFYSYRKFSTQDELWYVSIHKDVDSATLWVNLFLKTNGSSVNLESCVASIKMSVLNNLSYDSSITKEDVKKFTVSDYNLCYNWRDVIAWSDLTDENKGFIDEHDCFTLAVQLDVRDIHTVSSHNAPDGEGQNVVELNE